MLSVEAVADRIIDLAENGAFVSRQAAVTAIAAVLRTALPPIQTHEALQEAGRKGGKANKGRKCPARRRGDSDYYRRISLLRARKHESKPE